MVRLVVSICVLLVAVLSSGVESSKRSYIVNGYDINITEAPYQISLQMFGNHFCGGSVISTTWVLTAAHLISIENAVSHPKFNNTTKDYDFSLLQLSRPITIGNNSQVIPLARHKEPVLVNTTCMVSGWGSIGNIFDPPVEILQAIIVQTYSQEKCNSAYPGLITNRMICAGYHERRGICSADSGGPLVARGILVGVVSWSNALCGDLEHPGVYGRVAAVRYWIKDVANV